MLGPRHLPAALLLLCACAWISDNELAQRKDQDGDGHISTAFGGDDCEDTDAQAFPDAPERCNAIDDDCDGEVDEELPEGAYTDDDGDGYGTGALLHAGCAVIADGEATLDGDCDDDDPDRNPGEPEVCGNGVDDDCNDASGDTGETTWYLDADGDGFGVANSVARACAQPQGYVLNDLDCDDTDPAVNPDAEEVCLDGVDNDCDVLTLDAC